MVLADAVAAVDTGLVGQLVDLLKTGGPYTVAVLALGWAVKKDRDNEKTTRELFTKTAELATAQTAAMVKFEGTLANVKDALQTLVNKNQGH